MSTKIYHAWRSRHRTFYLALEGLRGKAFEYAAKTVRAEIKGFDKARFEAEYKAFLKEKEQKDSRLLRRIFQVRAAFSLAQDASRSLERLNPCEIDASLNVWLYGDHVYAIGYGECWNQFDRYVPPGAEDYCYWNNVDRPDDVSAPAWRQRGKTWDAAFGDNWDANRLVHQIIDAKEDVGLHELSEMLLPKINSMMVVP